MSIRPFARIRRADEKPGHCVRCPRKDDLIDLGVDGIPGFGIVYLCTVCTGELIDQLGYVSRGDHQAAVARVAEESTRNIEALADAERRANLPVDFMTALFEEFSRGIAVLSDDLVRDLAAGPAGRGGLDGLVAGLAAPVADGGDDRVADSAGGDAAEPLLGGDGSGADADEDEPGVPLEGARQADSVDGASAGASDVWGLLNDDSSAEAGDGDDDAPRD